MGAMSFVSDDILARSDLDLTVLEIHNLAYFYHWGREECWNTPCTIRGVFNDQIRQQLKVDSGTSKGGSPSKPKYKESNF